MSAESSGDQVQQLYLQHHRWLTGWLQRRLGCSFRAADLCHDTFVRILSADNAATQVQAVREPRSYLATIANRVLIDHLRRRALEKAWLESLALAPEAVDISPEQRLLLLEALQQLDCMLTGLGSKVREAFLLSQLQGLRYSEIAERLGVSVSMVKKYMAKATEHCLLYALELELS
ncbi:MULTISPECIES: sigma-70 family RNA polymerase sigma factor [Pseudomonas]|uniref:RNA polymerase subunit sigma n=1 Tax=Pseudomonas abyssi TaxID=170540 RepID=A0A2A3MKH4_9PSED|nr:sigma-70 family RNA polymerase sigma factor [Pseudomonas abyssi]MAC98892.1 RNA polymerase subunit sigma [Pseudomonadales bacterium]MAG64497.1 RNA polymerase subunit sigma [Pseudomonadales bacterium]PBK05306.1 RNA polymerase subunit sigma [Pseudomonas abyssi]